MDIGTRLFIVSAVCRPLRAGGNGRRMNWGALRLAGMAGSRACLGCLGQGWQLRRAP